MTVIYASTIAVPDGADSRQLIGVEMTKAAREHGMLVGDRMLVTLLGATDTEKTFGVTVTRGEK